MHKNYGSTKRFGNDGWLLTIQIKGTTRDEAAKALHKVCRLIRAGTMSGADSTDAQAYIFKFQEAAR